MAGLLGGVLPALFSEADQIKRRVKGLLSGPSEFMGQRAQDLQTMQDQDSAAMYGLLGGKTSGDPRMAQFARSDPAWTAQQADASQRRWLDLAMMGATSKAPKPEYQGGHAPPLRDSGAPAFDLTGGGKVYPDDIYGPMASRYYGHYGSNHPLDVQTIGLLHGVKNRPNATVTIYRAVPYEPTAAEQLAKLEKQKAQYMARRIVPPEWGGSRTSIGDEVGFYEHVTKEIERLKAAQDAPATKVTINPGDWVTPNRAYAKEHGEGALNGKYKIISKKVKAKDIYTNGDSIHEFGYDPTD